MNKLRSFLSSPPSGLPLDDVLELAKEQLEDARNATTSVKALLLCDKAKAMIKEAENIFNNNGTAGYTLNNDIASLYYKHGKQLEELGHCDKAQRSYSKAKKWGYRNVASRHRISSQSAIISDLVHLPLCPPPALSAVPIISAVVFQSPTLNINATGFDNFKSVLKKQNGQEPQYIFGKGVVPPAAKPALPEPGDRIVSTSQLAYCLSLLSPEAVSKVDITEAEYAWLHHTYNDLEEQGRLRTLAKEVVRAFVRDELKTPETVAEVVSLAAVLQQDEFRKLLQIFIDGIEQGILLDVHLLDGLAHIMRNHPQRDFDADDLIKILSLLGKRLKDTHRQSTQYALRLATTVSRVLDSMVDSQVEGINRQQLHKPLSNYLKELQDSSDPCLVFQAAYSYQALLYIPDDESILNSMIRRTGRVIQGISGVVSAVKALDLNKFIEGLQNIHGGLEGMDKAISIIGEVYQNTKRLADSGHEFLVCLQEGFSFSRRSAWYPALRGLDTLLQEGRLTALEKLIRGAPCRHNLAFQWGVCQRLGEIAANPIWDTDTRKGAVLLLVELYTDDLT
ncbi:hypothetical protein BGX21_005368 [Mortierella sp. AD011]|nr:hypothetical protein BGX21_005368 [Mortierella sp. AD011]